MRFIKTAALAALVVVPTFASAQGAGPAKGHRTVAEHIATRKAMEAKQDRSAAIREANKKKFVKKENARFAEHKEEALAQAKRDAAAERNLKKK